ncbi:MAG: acyltransferase family protein [Microbacteriaceae bacterium]
MTFFFVLSGFVLTWSFSATVRQSTFYWRRFARIWPATMVALLIAIPVFYDIGIGHGNSFYNLKPFDIGILLLSVFLLQGWFHNPAIFFSGNPAAWTHTFEGFFYLVHPYAMRVLRRLTIRRALIVVAVLIAWMFLYRGMAFAGPDSWIAQLPLPVVRLPEFLIGMALAWAMRRGWKPRIPQVLGIALLPLVVVTVAISAHSPALQVIPHFNNELFTVAVAVTIVSVASVQARGQYSIFAERWQVKLGAWSFAFYLVHATVIYAALRIFGRQELGWWNWALVVPLLAAGLVIAWALHTFVEHPVELRLRRWKDARDRTTQAPPMNDAAGLRPRLSTD